MHATHRDRVEALLAEAAAKHADLMGHLPRELQESLPVDAQGVTHAIDHLATAAGLSQGERRARTQPTQPCSMPGCSAAARWRVRR